MRKPMHMLLSSSCVIAASALLAVSGSLLSAQVQQDSLPAEGTLFRGLIKPNRWVKVDADVLIDLSENNRSDALARSYGYGNLPVVPADEGLYINTVELNVHREPKSDSMLGFGPLPGPRPTKPDFGYMAQLIYGRCASGLMGASRE